MIWSKEVINHSKFVILIMWLCTEGLMLFGSFQIMENMRLNKCGIHAAQELLPLKQEITDILKFMLIFKFNFPSTHYSDICN